MSSPQIAIIGAGPSGLTLARILLQKGIKTTIYEAETSPNARSQGGTLDLHPRSGQLALKEAGLLGEFEKVARFEGEDFILCDKTGKQHVSITETERGRPEIDREVLRMILLDSLPEEVIQWGRKVSEVKIGTIHFQDGSSQMGIDLIVGADGAWSKARHLLSHIPPFYSGISGFDIRLADAKVQHPKIDAMVGNGSMFVFGESDRQALLTQRLGDGSLRSYAVGHKRENWIKDIDFTNTEEMRSAMLKDYANWSPELTRIIRDIDVEKGDSITPRALYMLPVGLQWPSVPGVTLIGDAAHLMTPFAGEGVNMAMQDALELALAIVKSPTDLASAVQEYEKEMFPRAAKMTQKTWDSLLSRFAPGAIQQFKNRVRRQLVELGEKASEHGNIQVTDDEKGEVKEEKSAVKEVEVAVREVK